MERHSKSKKNNDAHERHDQSKAVDQITSSRRCAINLSQRDHVERDALSVWLLHRSSPASRSSFAIAAYAAWRVGFSTPV
jgi:hypothetical protein